MRLGLPIFIPRGKFTDHDAFGFLRLLIDIWKSMVSGAPIDDQREMRSGGRLGGEVKAEQEAQSSSVIDNGPRPPVDSDEEEDPNDYVPRPEAHKSEAPATEAGYEFDVSDYGSDSD
jgi:hypothetical protein